MPHNWRAATPSDGISVTGEAVRRVSPESAEFLMEVTTSAPTAAQALRDNQAKASQIANLVAPIGVQPSDMQTISMNIYNLYAPMIQALPGYGGLAAQLGPAGMGQPAPGSYGQTGSYGQPEAGFNPYEMQFGAYHARNTVRVNVRDASRVGEVVDAAVKGGGVILGAFALRAPDEAGARKAALEAAGRDARARAEALAAAAGKKLGDPVSIAEDLVASNGTYMALRSAMPLAFGPAAPQTAGELEYYARVSARFGFQ